MSANNDGSESVDQFLARIASVKEGRDEENEARTRRMEDEILKGRQERQARRLERARSISPSKTGPAKVFSAIPSKHASQSSTDLALNPPIDFSPRSQQSSQAQTQPLSPSNAVTGRVSPTKDFEPVTSRPLPSPSLSEENTRPQPTATGLARSGTLSWQQRPSSRDGGGSRQRPLSGFATVRTLPQPPSSEEQNTELSRKDIAASLAQKDPTWFRQTQERGTGSAAFRKNQVEEPSEPLQTSSMPLPGMLQAREHSKSPAPETHGGRESPRNIPDLDRFKRGTTPDIIAMRNSFVMERSQPQSETDPTGLENDKSEIPTPSLPRAPSALSSNRPISPTKGLGGFVESAMMKRSDSVSKRWSVKANTGLKRGDSIAGGRPTSLHSRGLSRDVPVSRDGTPSSPLASSRPTSTHGRDPLASPSMREKARSVEPQEDRDIKADPVRPVSQVEQDDSQLARSPSKTMDPRRWSPTKSTWLESALQADSPKPPLLKEEPPKWKIDLQRSKSRASRDVSPDKRPLESENENIQAKTPSSTNMVPPPLAPKPVTVASSTTALPKPETIASSYEDEAVFNTKVPPTIKDSDDVMQKSSKSLPSRPVNEPSGLDSKENNETSKKPPVLKPKPQTPPKTDFRAGLKSRGAASAQNNDTEPEFKAVFGKLKRATTQNYVAPDELKTNILSGKAALNATGGPQKTKRVDEFKESILAKKEAMKAAGIKAPERSQSPTKEEAPIPEALVRRKTLSKPTSAPGAFSAASSVRATPPVLASKPATIVKAGGSAVTNNVKADKNAPSAATAASSSTEPDSRAFLRDAAAPVGGQELPKITPKGMTGEPKQTTVSNQQNSNFIPASKMTEEINSSPSNHTTSGPPSGELSLHNTQAKNELPPHSKLASRLNPNLAAMLSRGNSPRPQAGRGTSEETITRAIDTSSTSAAHKEEDPSSSLTHMTKARAKGPKRRAPKAEVTAVSKKPPQQSVLRSLPISERVSVTSATSELEKLVDSQTPDETPQKPVMALRELAQPKTSAADRTPVKFRAVEQELAPKIEEPKLEEVISRPMIASKSPELRKVSSPIIKEEKIKASPKPAPANKPNWSPAAKPATLAGNNNTIPAQAVSPIPGEKSSVILNKVRDPVTPNKKFESKPNTPAAKPASVHGLGLGTRPLVTASKPVVKPQARASATATEPKKKAMLPVEMKSIIENYVGPVLNEYERADFDSQRFLTEANHSEERVKTLTHTINEITGDGKRSALSSGQEHILFEDCMYIITHGFSTPNGAKSTEVYLWCGNRVSDATVEDAQIFCRRDAREHNTKLIVSKQGKESSQLIQALGGILITRRNKNSALYMLCGRRHLGHIVFDEVEMESSNLCSGYTYLISAQYGNLYLWKGKGACADEVGSARLIGMDLGLTGEIEEVDDGAEPASFWEALGSRTPNVWSDDWAKRAELNGYPTVMYRIEHERPGLLGNLWGLKRAASPSKGQQMKGTCEVVESFTQGELESSTIHIIDAYRTIYVVVTRQCSSKAAELVTALHLAQDFAMLSPATQDRPLLPACYVVAGEFPPDLKACFRKWSEAEAQSIAKKDSICVRLEEVMEALDL